MQQRLTLEQVKLALREYCGPEFVIPDNEGECRKQLLVAIGAVV